MSIARNHTDTSGDVNAPGATMSVTLPTGAASTDIIILIIASGAGSGTVGTWTAPSGWTAIYTHQSQTSDGGGGVDIAGFWSLGNNANLSFTKSGTVGFAGWVCSSFSGVDNTTPIDATGTTNSNKNATSLTANLVTVATDQAWEIIQTADYNDGVMSATSFTNSENAHSNQTASNLINTTPKSVGSTGTVSVASNGSGTNQAICAAPFALRPAGGAAAVTYPQLERMQRGLNRGISVGVAR